MLVRPQLSYPGVYVQEVSGGPGPIVGVPTSVTAFIGRAVRGPVEEPVVINDMGAFERHFGGLGYDFPMSYAVRDFFENGGTQAVIVRLFGGGAPATVQMHTIAPWVAALRRDLRDGVKSAFDEADGELDRLDSGVRELAARFDGRPLETKAVEQILTDVLAMIDEAEGGGASASLKARIFEVIGAPPANPETLFALTAASPGAWGNRLHAWIDFDGIGPDTEARYAADGLKVEQLFNLHLALVDARGRILESEDHNSVTLKPGTSRTLGLVLADVSALARTTHTEPDGARPPDGAGGQVSADVDDGSKLQISDYANPEDGKGFNAFDKAAIINLMCVPPDVRGGDTHPAVYAAAVAYARKRLAFLIVDGPAAWDEKAVAGQISEISPDDLKISGELARDAAVYFPRVKMADPLAGDAEHVFPVSGLIAGIYARTDRNRGVWKAPAGTEAGVDGVVGLSTKLTDAHNGQLNALGINCLRTFPTLGTVVWGARTLAGAAQLADDYAFVPVRRTALYIAESLQHGTRWAVFQPNDESLWAQLRSQVGSFMSELFRQGAFQGSTANDAFFVRCDATTDIDVGIVTVLVGFAPLKPGEFVVLYIQQKTATNP